MRDSPRHPSSGEPIHRPSLLLGLTFCLLAATAARASDPVLDGLRSRDAERRRTALDTLLADPDAAVERVAASRLIDALDRLREKDRDPVLRGLAARGLTRVGGSEERLDVLESLATEESWEAREAVLRALEGVDDREVVDRAVERAFRGDDPAIRARFARAIGRLGGARARSALLALEQSEPHWIVRAGVFLGLGHQPSMEAVDRCLAGLSEDDPAVAVAAREALERITGRRDLVTADDWRAWWKEERETFDPDTARREKEGETAAKEGDDRYEVPERHLPRYYGIPIRGTRVAFCVDVSASMVGPKFEAAVEELTAAVKSLPSRVEITVFFFNEHVRPWPERPIPAFPSTKQALIDVIPELEIKSYTNIHDALERALGLAGHGRWPLEPAPGLDDVFIVSDGEPNRGRYRDQKGILMSLDRLNRGRAVRIHGISIGDRPRDLLKAIAAAHGGAFEHRSARGD